MPASTQLDLTAALKEHFGHDEFLPGQEAIIRRLLDGRDVLAILPTGGGKSLIYQLAAQVLPGITIVVAPLLALMQDQVESLEEQGIDASVVSSMQSEGQSEAELEQVKEQETKLLYVTPERFDDDEFMADMRDVEVSLFVVDEAHCVSEWGHDFRPAYLGLATAIERFGRPTVLALTATATPWVRRDIVERLELRDPHVAVHGTDRPNLFLEVRRAEDDRTKQRVLQDLFTGEAGDYPPDVQEKLTTAMQGSGIIYTATTKAARETARWLQEWGIAADYYHGQRKKSDRQRVQDAFMQGEVRVIAATNAFGMGVDKSDVRFVIHRDVPASVEEYYQEAGRAGRDGELARCTLLYRAADLGRAAFLSASSRVSQEDVARAHEALKDMQDGEVDALAEKAGLNKSDTMRVLTILERDGIVETDGDRVRMLVQDFDPAQISLRQEEQRHAYERSRLDMMRGYAETVECRREYILNYFGEAYDPACCHMCDRSVHEPDAAEHTDGSVDDERPPFTIGEPVVHDALGEGTVQRVTSDTITVLFEDAGYTTLDAEFVEEHDVLHPVDDGTEDEQTA